MKPGYDVLTDTDDRHKSFTSKYANMNVLATGSATVHCLAGQSYGTAVVSHGLGYVPLAFAWIPAQYGDESTKQTVFLPSAYPNPIFAPTDAFVGLNYLITNGAMQVRADQSYYLNGLDFVQGTFDTNTDFLVYYAIFYNKID